MLNENNRSKKKIYGNEKGKIIYNELTPKELQT